MNVFDRNRIENNYFKIKGLKYEVPFTVVNPIHKSKKSKIIVFMNGLNGDRAWLKYFNHSVFDNNFLISFDQKGQAKNEEKPSQIYQRLINYNLKVLEYIFKDSKYKNREIILIGESWGANCALLMAKKRPDLMKGFLIWNMPGKLPSKNVDASRKKIISMSFKTWFTFMTGINTKSIIPFDERLTSNRLLIRASKYQKNLYMNNKTPISIFLSFIPSWRIIIKNRLTVPFVYVQSMQDIMLCEKRFKKIKNNSNTVIFEKGCHILYLEENSLALGDEIQKFILSI